MMTLAFAMNALLLGAKSTGGASREDAARLVDAELLRLSRIRPSWGPDVLDDARQEVLVVLLQMVQRGRVMPVFTTNEQASAYLAKALRSKCSNRSREPRLLPLDTVRDPVSPDPPANDRLDAPWELDQTQKAQKVLANLLQELGSADPDAHRDYLEMLALALKKTTMEVVVENRLQESGRPLPASEAERKRMRNLVYTRFRRCRERILGIIGDWEAAGQVEGETARRLSGFLNELKRRKHS